MMRGMWRRVLPALLFPTSVHFALGYWRRALVFLAVGLALQLVGVPLLGGRLLEVVIAWFILVFIDALRLEPRRQPEAADWVRILVIFFFAAGAESLAIRSFWVEAFKVPAGSMIPTLQVGDHMMVDKRARRPARGDVIVFAYPRDRDIDFVKRVVAVGGDTIEIRDDALFINGKRVERAEVPGDCSYEDYDEMTNEWQHKGCQAFEETLGDHRYRVVFDDVARPSSWHPHNPFQLPPDSYFVLGDNRNNSHDSRYWGIVPQALVKGTVRVVWWSNGPEGVRWDRRNVAVQ